MRDKHTPKRISVNGRVYVRAEYSVNEALDAIEKASGSIHQLLQLEERGWGESVPSPFGGTGGKRAAMAAVAALRLATRLLRAADRKDEDMGPIDEARADKVENLIAQAEVAFYS